MVNNYIPTNDIKNAVKGQEVEVLNALGIQPTSGNSHIQCPYPDHDDNNPSWRWDIGKACAFCTCIPDGSHSIFDVVSKMTDQDFDACKVRVAEVLGRPDLIQDRKNKHQKTTAKALLNAPKERRDDTLPYKYIASRLGISIKDTPEPTTLVAGHISLEYWDPPKTKNGDPKLFGKIPCAVFGTVDADGKEHAFRIYLSEDGAAKANLGENRNPKKSAKVIKGENTAGRSAIWGNPAKAQTIVLCEGIETGATLAFAQKEKIAENEIAVAAAISASGVKAFRPWPNTQKVIVGADRDEDSGDSRTGENAARVFALQNRAEVEVSISLPGKSGEHVDFLDILRRDGAEEVCRQLTNAVAFEPTQEELDAEQNNQNSDAEIKRVAVLYPLPILDTERLEYDATQFGRVKIHRQGKNGMEPVATPMGVPALLRFVDKDNAYGLRVVVQDMAGNPRPLDLERGSLAKISGTDVKAMLYDAGLRTEGDGERVAMAILKASEPKKEILCVSRPGWHEIAGLDAPIFASPAGEVYGAPDGTQIELSVNARLVEPIRAGTFEQWQEAAGAAMSVQNCPHWTIGVVAGFAGVVLSLTGLDTCGLNLSGLSSSGKSTAQRLAASVWATPRVGAGLLQSMRTTENALESLAQNSSGTILALDEMAHADGRVVSRMIYSIASGVGKSRMRADATVKERYRWSTFALLSGECSLEEKIRSDGGQFTAGMAVRIADLDITGINRAVDQATIDNINSVSNHYGHAGPAFARALIADNLHHNPDALREKVLSAARKIAGAGADSARIRAATTFGLLLVSGELAQTYDVISKGADIAGSIMWAWWRFEKSSDAMALDPDKQAIAFLQIWIAERWDVSIRNVVAPVDSYGNQRLANREAHAWYDDTAIYIPTKRIREATGDTLKEQHIAKLLSEAGLIAKRGGNSRIATRYIPIVGHVDCYALKIDELGVRTTNTDVVELFEEVM
jgi:hypothetical protein